MNNLDRRAFIAFALSMLLFVAFYMYYSPVMEAQQERAAEERARKDTLGVHEASKARPTPTYTPSGSAEAAISDTSAVFPTGSRDSAGTIVVSSPLYQMTFSLAGAELVSFELKKYESSGKPVQLINQAGDSLAGTVGMACVELVGRSTVESLSNVVFEAYLMGPGRNLPPGTQLVLNSNNQGVTLVFRAEGKNGEFVEKSYELRAESYEVKVGLRASVQAFPDAEAIRWGFGKGLRSTEKNKADDYMNFQASLKLGEELYKKKPSNFSRGKKEVFSRSGTVRWVALQTKYFTAAMIPTESLRGTVDLMGDKETHFVSAKMELPIIPKAQKFEQQVVLYVGPLDFELVKALGVGLEKNINMGYKLIRPVSWVILWSLIALYKVIPNYGLVIIILSVFTKVLFYRLTHKSFKSMRDMQAIQPKLQALKEKYKDDKQKLSSETMKLYKEAGVNPLGGCLPMLLQAPVFIALFSVLKYTIELRGAHFIWWINDLSSQDVLYRLPFALPFIGKEVSLLPLLMGAAMLLQTKIGGSITGGATSATQPKAFTYILPLVFTLIFYKMPSGLVLYWFVNNILSIAQQYYINKEAGREGETTVEKGVSQKRTKRQLQKER